MSQVERGDALMPSAKRTAHEAQTYAYQLNSAIIPVSVDSEGNATSLLAPGDNDTALMTFSRPEFVGAVIGMRLGLNLVGYEDMGRDHAFPAAFPPENSKVQPAQLTIPTVRYECGRRVYLFQARKGVTVLPSLPPRLRRLPSSAILALPSPLADSHTNWEVKPSEFAFITLDMFAPDPPAQISDTALRMGRPR